MNSSNRTGVVGRLAWLILLSALLSCGAQLASAGHAFAHAALVRVEPTDGAVVPTPPASFSLTFSEPTSPLVLALVRPDGTRIPLDRFRLRDATLEIEAPAGLGRGSHVLTWRIVSEDGHPVGGSAVFSIGAPSANAAPIAGETVDGSLRLAIWIAKLALYVGLFIGIGGIFFTHWIGGGSSAATRAALWTVGLALVAAPLSVGLQGLDALGLPLAALGNPIVWTTGYATSFGMTALLAAVALVAALMSALIAAPMASPMPNPMAARTRAVLGRGLSLLAFLGVGLALAASGHASAAHPQGLTRPAVFLHAVGIAFWAGALMPLAAAFAAKGTDAVAALGRFSKVIPLAVLPLVAAGTVLALIQLGSIEALWSTAYGRLLLLKLILLAPLFVLAAINRFRLTKPAAWGDPRAIRWLRRVIRVELALVLAIFAVAALWRFTPPPRALAEAAAAPTAVHIHSGKAMADLVITPGRAGPASASIMIMTGDFGPLEAKAITLVLSNPAAGIEQIRRPAAKSQDGGWRIEGLTIPLPGRWTARLDILVSDFELIRLDGGIDVRP